ncbi:XRE family transcriptional regulator [Bacillus pseudomycoides]|uniref:helix-turn-helix domain-containing protein n=1 Tax=Bacillus pseudomycoides TaxID=64104 RepID=UPI00059EBC8B|nr:helix-turn-helix transcriptional regulator [Bacillus pseudomycoides]PDZ72480.1 XRE family transcriptional regulator [Bacillus pseudomycoides]PEJ23418.1 XRE family transcriptional regulator [Bacillus pseudomycoides]PEM41490.1 XRE family transcriptional regulator [Bacillus pseudomycoides]
MLDINRICRHFNLSQHDLAKKTGILQPSLSRMNSSDVKLSTIIKIAGSLGVSVVELINISEGVGN